MANVLKPERQEVVLRCLVEGASVRSTERMTGVHRDTIIRLMRRVAKRGVAATDDMLRDLDLHEVQVDEVWAYVGKKNRTMKEWDDREQVGSFYTFVAIDRYTKLVPSVVIGKRDSATCHRFIEDLAGRLGRRIQLSSDYWPNYINAVRASFEEYVDFGQVLKVLESDFRLGGGLVPGGYSPPRVTDIKVRRIIGNPAEDRICTSHVERSHLTLRMACRRLTRLTNAFSKTLASLVAAVRLHYLHYNFVRPHGTLGTTPAVVAGITRKPWGLDRLVEIAR